MFRHGLRVVDQLERRYPAFPGLNLSWELREAMAKHTTRHDRPTAEEFNDGLQPVLEAQAVEVADEGILLDVDTPADYDRLVSRYRAGSCSLADGTLPRREGGAS